ncbi:type II toxin-antitoxin system RelE/ParE family toxin [Rhodoferax lacus]|uniref:type II toxin-antitoxin system RelE/ParE family toxin n=1 Tax=Rhodoferax lacus TaxID=2184758 RepID=UPI0018F315E0|nr:type II toxin-antitoxin system RelE/ParE family toxin [Rhodoferax lacus]
MPLVLNSTKSFDRIIKKLHAKDKKVLDDAVKVIQGNPSVGEEKRGDLVGVFVYKFKMNGQETLLAYELHPNKKKPTTILLMAVGPHENFYAQLKRAK